MYYDENVLMAMASVIGRPVRVDQNTLKVQRGRFARVCVEIDLSKLVVGKIWMRDHWYRVEYKGLHLICAKCGCYGHMTRECTNSLGVQSPDSSLGKDQEATPPPENLNAIIKEPSPTPNTGIAMVLTPHVSQGTAGTIYDLDKQTHGEWMTVVRRKKSVKAAPQNPFDGLKDSIQRTNNFVTPLDGSGGSKVGTKSKQRRQDNSQPNSSIVLPQQATSSKPPDKGKVVASTKTSGLQIREPHHASSCPIQNQDNMDTSLQGTSMRTLDMPSVIQDQSGIVTEIAMDSDLSHIT